MVELRDAYYGGVNGAQTYATERLGGVWEALERRPRLHRVANAIAVDLSVRKLPTRPNPLSAMADYTSWASLTDRTYDGRHLPPVATDRELPEVDRVAALFTRPPTGMVASEKSSVLFPYFAQWFVDGFLRSERPRPHPETGELVRDPAKNESNHEIDLIQVYGAAPATTRELRTGQDGLLKSQQLNGEEYPPYLYDGSRKLFETVTVVRDGQITPDQRRQLFALGSDTGNLQLGFVLMSVLFLREHNRIARALKEEYPWDDERLFQTARNILTVILVKIVVEEYINHISPSRFAFLADPVGLRNPPWYRPNWMAIEFNLLYRWHSLVPSTFRIGDRDVAVRDTLFTTDTVVERGLASCFEDASRQPAGRLGLFNSPPEVWEAEAASVRQARAVRLDSYNAYRRLARFPRARRFADISSDPRVQEGLREVYGHVDAVEFYPGLFAEDVQANGVLPPLIGRMVAADAFSQAFTNPLLAPRVFTEQTFSPLGWSLIHERHRLSDLVHRNTPPAGRRRRISMTREGWTRT
jgi:prostaglandin-endoperoxide synthase 2